jgi:beta-lactamase class A
MRLFGKKEEYEDPEEFVDSGPPTKKLRDLNPQNRRWRKEPPKPWTKRDRLIVLWFLIITVILAGVLDLTSKDWKLPNFPRLEVSKLTDLNPLKEETITLGQPDLKQQKADKVIAQFKSMTNDLTGVYGFRVVDLESGFTYGVNDEEVYTAASLMKLPIIALTYKNEQGKYLDLIERMAQHSDNNAYNYMRQTVFTEDEINAYVKELGLTQTNYDNNEMSPADVAKYFTDLWNDKIMSETDKDQLLTLLTKTDFEKWLAGGITDVRVAHKYGREVHVVNDGGIIYAANPFVLVIMSKGIVDQEADDIFPQLAKMIYEGQTQ